MSMSILPPVVQNHIFYFLPPEDIAKTCRAVSKNWEQTSKNLDLWKSKAASLDIELDLKTAAQQIEKRVKDYLVNKHLTILSIEQLDKKIIQFFRNIGETETRALQYLCARNPQSQGFYIISKDPSLLNKTTPLNVMKIIDLFEKIDNRLTITGKGDADLQDEGPISIGNGSNYVYHMDKIGFKVSEGILFRTKPTGKIELVSSS